MKKRILEVVGRMDRAGQETFLMNVLRAYDPNEYEIWFSVNTAHVGDYESEILALGGKIWHNPYSISIRNLYPYLKAFKKFLKAKGPFDVIHCHVYFFGGFILKIAHQEKIPVRIMHSHSTSDGLPGTYIRRAYRWFCRRLIKKHATQLVACGEEAYQALFQEKCPGKDKVLSNAIVMRFFDLTNEDAQKTRQSLGISEDAKVVINVGRFLPVKNHKKIVNVFERYHKSINENSVLLLVGDGDDKCDIEALTDNLNLKDSVKFLGKRSDIPQLLNASDVLLMPSLYEGLPVSLIEAQAAGVCCVVSDVITNEVDMKLGLIRYVNLGANDESWACEIAKAMQKSKPSFMQRDIQISKMGYTIDATWNKLKKLYG